MEYDPRNASIEIERLKFEINDLKKQDQAFGDFPSKLITLQNRFENFKQEKKSSEVVLTEKLQFTKSKIQEASYDRDRFEKQFYSLNSDLKNVKIGTEEINEALGQNQDDLQNLNRFVLEKDESLQIIGHELSKATRSFEKASDERKELKSSFGKFEEDLKSHLKLDKELEDNEIELDINEARIKADTERIEKEMAEINQKEQILLGQLKTNESEQLKMKIISNELEKEALDLNSVNDRYKELKEGLSFKVKQENQKNLKLEGLWKQYQSIFAATEEGLESLIEKLRITDERVVQKTADHAHNLTMLTEDKKELERMIKTSEDQNEYLLQIYTLHKDIAQKLEGHSRHNKLSEFKNELIRILE
jgi:hypothetical protein